MSAVEKPSFLHSATPSGQRKRPKICPFNLSEASLEKDRRSVYLRIKPNSGKSNSFVALDDKTLVPIKNDGYRNRKGMTQQYKFSKIFSSECQQEEIFQETCTVPLTNFLHGGNCLVFAYGATNAGKTFTIQGNPEEPGIIPRALNLLFNSIKDSISGEIKFKPDKVSNVLWLSPEDIEKEQELKHFILNFNLDKTKVGRPASTVSFNSEASNYGCSASIDSSVICSFYRAMTTNLKDEKIELDEDANNVYSVWVSYVEIYNENIYDLLQPLTKPQKALVMGENGVKDVYIKGLTDVSVFSAEEAYKVFMYGQHNLHQASTSINHTSSRSHSIFSVRLIQHLKIDNPSFARLSVCTFVDLAGAERAKKTHNAGERMKESQSINTSLHVLGKCLEVLRHNQKGREATTRILPCRESKLTRLFQRALEGKEILTMIVNINQDEKLFDETLNVLKFSAIAMELKFDKSMDSTKCSLRKSSFSLYIEKLSCTLRSSMEAIEEVPEDTRYMKLLAYIEELKKDLDSEKKKNSTLEMEIRKEAYTHFRKIMMDMQNMHSQRLSDERQAYAEYEMINSKLFRSFLDHSSKRRRSNLDESEDESSDDEEVEERIRYLENKVEALTGLAEAGEQVKAAYNTLQTKYSKSQCELAVAQENLRSALKVNEVVAEAEDGSDSAMDELKNQLKKHQNLLKERDLKIEEIEKMLEVAKAEYDEHLHEHEDFAARNAELENALAGRDLRIEDLQSQLDICNKKLSVHQQKINTRESEEADHTNKLQEVCEARDEFKFKVVQLECDIKKLRKENEELKNQARSPQNDNELKSLQLLLASHEDKLKKYEEKITVQESSNKSLVDEVCFLKSQSICSNSDSYEREIKILEAEIKETIKMKKDLMEEIQKLTQELKQSKEAVITAEAALLEEQNNTKAMRKVCESEKNQLFHEIKHKQALLKQLEEESDTLSRENNDLKLQIMELEESVKVKADIAKLKEQLKDAYMQISELQKEKKSCMDISNTKKDLYVHTKTKSKTHSSRTRKGRKENLPHESEGEECCQPLPVPEVPIKPDPDATRQLRPRRKKILYTSDDSKV